MHRLKRKEEKRKETEKHQNISGAVVLKLVTQALKKKVVWFIIIF